MKNLLTLPHSTAAIERIFSQVTINRTKLRNGLQVRTLNQLLSIKSIAKAFQITAADFDPSAELLKMINSQTLYDDTISVSYDFEFTD
jgi:hypothetical protein